MEHRRFCSVTTWSGSYITDLSDDIFGVVAFGDNGDEWGVSTASAGTGGIETVSLFPTWDYDYSNGVDSGWRDFSLSINGAGDGSAALTCGEWTNSFNVETSLSLNSVTIRAVVRDSGMRMDWSGVSISFRNNGSAGEWVSVGTVVADTLASSNHTPFESVAVVTGGSNYNGVVVTGRVRLQANAGVYPGSQDIFGQVLIS